MCSSDLVVVGGLGHLYQFLAGRGNGVDVAVPLVPQFRDGRRCRTQPRREQRDEHHQRDEADQDEERDDGLSDDEASPETNGSFVLRRRGSGIRSTEPVGRRTHDGAWRRRRSTASIFNS